MRSVDMRSRWMHRCSSPLDPSPLLENFIKAVKENRSLLELDLSSNLIGKAENLNTGWIDA